MNEPEGLISLREAARRLGVGNYTLRRLVKSGELRGFRVRTVLMIRSTCAATCARIPPFKAIIRTTMGTNCRNEASRQRRR